MCHEPQRGRSTIRDEGGVLIRALCFAISGNENTPFMCKYFPNHVKFYIGYLLRHPECTSNIALRIFNSRIQRQYRNPENIPPKGVLPSFHVENCKYFSRGHFIASDWYSNIAISNTSVNLKELLKIVSSQDYN